MNQNYKKGSLFWFKPWLDFFCSGMCGYGRVRYCFCPGPSSSCRWWGIWLRRCQWGDDSAAEPPKKTRRQFKPNAASGTVLMCAFLAVGRPANECPDVPSPPAPSPLPPKILFQNRHVILLAIFISKGVVVFCYHCKQRHSFQRSYTNNEGAIRNTILHFHFKHRIQQ